MSQCPSFCLGHHQSCQISKIEGWNLHYGFTRLQVPNITPASQVLLVWMQVHK